MCDLEKNGWDEHKKVVYHKIDGNTDRLKTLATKQDAILAQMHSDAVNRTDFEARIEVKVNRMEKIVYGALGAATIAVFLQIINLVIGNGGP